MTNSKLPVMYRKSIPALFTLVSAAGMLPTTITHAQDAEEFRAEEQFFLNDDDGTIKTGTTNDGKTRFEIRSGYAIVEGDIVFGTISDDGEPTLVSRGVGRPSGLDRWADGIVYYQKSPALSAEDTEKVNQAVAHWDQFSSLMFVERTAEIAETQTDYINFEPSGGCASWVGRIGGEQEIWVGEVCTVGSVIHEIGHAIGLFHEHTRSDRDSFITVQWENIIGGKEFNFDILDAGAEDVRSYDYDSVMHYGDSFFSRNGQPTILTPDGVQVGQRVALSQIDLESVNEMYATDLMLSTTAGAFGASMQVQLTVNNIGANGANSIDINVPVTPSQDGMQSFGGEGWSCGISSSEVACSLERLAPGEESTLTLNLANGSVDVDNIQGSVSSRSFDTDLSNNGDLPANLVQAGTVSSFNPNDGDNNAAIDESDGSDNDASTELPEIEPEVIDNTGDTDSSENTDQSPPPAPPSAPNLVGETSDTDATATPEAGQALPGSNNPVSNNPVTAAASGGSGGGALWALLGLLAATRLSRVIIKTRVS